jgi:nucleotidyltransferase substrate binding protein (TIGR01987 family)
MRASGASGTHLAMPLELTSLQKAVTALEAAVARSRDDRWLATLDDVTRNVFEAGVVQHFAVTYELCWKFVKRWLETNVSPTAADGVTRRELFRQAAEQRLVDDVDRWMTHHHARNQTSHLYDAAIAEVVFEAARGFASDARALLVALEARND